MTRALHIAAGLALLLVACVDAPPATELGQGEADASTPDAGTPDAENRGDVDGDDVGTLDVRGGEDDLPDAPVDDRPPVECGALSTCGRTCADLDADPFNCGACGRTCVFPNAQAACVEGRCALGACLAGFADADADPNTGCEAENTCQGGGECETACGTTGAIACQDDREVCQPPAEACNAADDNCDGACDEGPIPGCRVGVHRGSGNGHVYSDDLNFVSSNPYRLESRDYFRLYREPTQGMRPVFLCRKPNGLRFLTSDTACEIGVAPERQLGFWAAGPVCGAVPLYRMYHPPTGNHFFTLSAPERDNARDNLGYREEGTAGYVWRAP